MPKYETVLFCTPAYLDRSLSVCPVRDWHVLIGEKVGKYLKCNEVGHHICHLETLSFPQALSSKQVCWTKKVRSFDDGDKFESNVELLSRNLILKNKRILAF